MIYISLQKRHKEYLNSYKNLINKHKIFLMIYFIRNKIIQLKNKSKIIDRNNNVCNLNNSTYHLLLNQTEKKCIQTQETHYLLKVFHPHFVNHKYKT